ncbi:autotransporter-associated beta strand repeat-containing protein [Brevundimonas olei]|uniref:Autotransporter-associated beta strand repeat-containing protein n=1 Tax=Brevundimonas olei TaxID=657642 RepID=A0ABZ2IFC7_9CAUL
MNMVGFRARALSNRSAAVLLCGVSAAALLGLPSQASAGVDRYWDANATAVGSGGSGVWNTTSGFWSQSNDGVSGPYSSWNNPALDNAIFGGATSGTVTLGAPITVGGMTFETGGYVLNGGTLTLAGADPTISIIGSSVGATINSIVAGTDGLTKDKAGALTLNGVNTFTGTINLLAGTLNVNGDAALGAAANRVVASGGTVITAAGALDANRVIELASGMTSIGGAGVGSARFTGAGGLRVVQGVVLNNDASDFTGQINFSVNGAASFTSVGDVGEASSLGAGDKIRFTATNQYQDWLYYIGSGDSSNRDWEFATSGGTSGAVFVNDGTGTLTLSGAIAAIGAVSTGMSFVAQKADLELLGEISSLGDRNINFRGGGVERTITLGDANVYAGGTVIGASGAVTLRAGLLADAGVVSSFGTGTAGGVSIYSDSVLSYIGTGATSNRAWTIGPALAAGGMGGKISNDGTGALDLSGAVDFASGRVGGLRLGGDYAGVNTLSGVISGNGALVSSGAGTWELSGANTRTGAIVVDGGTLRAGSASAFGTTTDVTVNDGTLDLNGFDLATTTLAGTGGVVELGNATLSLGSTASTTFAGRIAGSGGLTKAGAGILTLTGANTYSGDTTLNGGGLTLDFSAAGAPTDNILSAGTTLNLAGSSVRIVGGAGAANSQAFDGLNVSAGNNRVVAAPGVGGDVFVNFGAINRTGGLIDFTIPSGAVFTTASAALGGWATVNQSDYAKVVGGIITAFEETDYNDKDDAAAWLDGDIISDVAGFHGTVGSSTQLGGLRYTQAVATTVRIAGGQTLGTDGTIIVAPSVLNNNQLITGGALTGSIGGGVLGLQQNSGGNFTIASTITDNGGAIGFTKGGNGRATLTGANTYTGATTLSGGVLAINSLANGGQASSLGMASADAANLVLEGGTLSYTGTGDTTDRGFTLVNGGATRTIEVVNGGANLVFGGLVTSPDDSGFIKAGAGTLTLANSANDYVGATTVNGGVLAVTTLTNGGEASSIGMAGSDSANLVLAGGTLDYLGATTSGDRGFTLNAGGGGIGVNSASTTLTLSGAAVGGGRLSKEGDGTLLLTGANSYSGGTQVKGGTLRAGSAQAFGSPSSFMTVDAGARLELGGYDITIGGLLGGGLVDLGGHTLTSSGLSANGFTGKITGAGGFTRTGSWTQTLSGCANDYTGRTTIAGSGTLSINCLANGGVASGIGASGSSSANLVFNSGMLAYTGASVTTDRGFTLQGAGGINVVDAVTTLDFTGQVVGAGALTKSGAGTLVLSGANTYAGGTTVYDGVLRVNSASAFGNSGALTLSNLAGVLVDLNGFNTTIGHLAGGGALGGDVALGGATLSLTTGGSGTGTYGGAISGAGALIKGGSYTQVLNGCNSTYTGGTTINGGVLVVSCLEDGGVASSIGISGSAASNLVINGGTLRYVGAGGDANRQFTLGASGGNALDASGSGAINFTYNGAVTFAAPDTAQTLTLTGVNTGDNTLAAQLTNNGAGVTSLNKTGAGTWILSNAGSTYTGATTISGGVLGVDKLADGGLASSLGASSSAASNLVIGNGSTLRYTGAGDITNRLFTLSAGVTFLESAGSGAIVFTDTGPVTLAGNNQARTIALGGSNTGDNTLAGSIGDAGTGRTSLAKNDAGTWVLTGTNTYSGNTVINAGLLKIGNGGTAGSILGDSFISGAGGLGFNRSDAYSYNGLISGSGAVRQIGSGVTTLTANNSYTGSTFVDGGALIINGDQSAATGLTTVASGATLGGRGIIGGDVSVGSGTLAPGEVGAAGALTINGNLLLGANSTLAMQFGQAGTAGGGLNDLIVVNGNVTLDGVLNVAETVGGAFGPGVYRIIDYTGSLIDNGLNLGALPSGTGVIQTAVAGQVNLLAGGLDFSFWDGDAGPKFDGVVSGGSGLWQNNAGNNNWTEATGNLNAAFDDDAFAIFAGAAGIVIIDNGLGQVTAKGMQFATDGYIMAGGPLVLTDPQSIIRVGDGTWAGAGFTATIHSAIAGVGQLVKTDAGTLILNGLNTYAGGTSLNAGTVQIAHGDALGTGAVRFDGGTLNTTANLALSNDVLLDGGGDWRINANTTMTQLGTVSGAGALYKSGAGTLTLLGDAIHTGGATIAEGTLQIGDGGTLGSLNGHVLNNSALVFNRSNVLVYADNISGSGSLSQIGAGTLNLTGNHNYMGASSVQNGAILLTNGGQITGTSGLNIDRGGLFAVDGAGSRLQTAATGVSQIGSSANQNGNLVVQNGGTTSFADLRMATGLNSAGSLIVTGAGSHVDVNGHAGLGVMGNATVNVLDRAKLTTRSSMLVGGQLSSQSSGFVTVSGAGSEWEVVQNLGLRRGSLTVSNGGRVTADTAAVGYYAGIGPSRPDADLLVEGAGSRLDVAGALLITNTNSPASRGAITIADGGVVRAGSLAMGPGDAALNIGGAEGAAARAAGTLDVGVVTMASAGNRINFNHVDADYRFSSAISGLGGLIHNGSGVTVLTGMNSYAGATMVNAGSLFINGDQSAATGLTSVNIGATLGGVGVIGGDVVVADGGALNPGGAGTSPGTLSIAGDLSLSNGSALNFSFGQANVPGGPLNDLINVGGDLTLAGTLNVDAAGSGTLDPGVYRVFNYKGALTDNGLLANLPSADFYVQTSVANQVNLVNTSGLALRFWDGAAGSKNDGVIDGGGGVWQAFGASPDNGEDNWTEDGTTNAPFQNAAFAVFAGTAGKVTVDDSKGAVNVSGMQFVTDGYVVTGDVINLAGASGAVIRVGDGTTDGAGATARLEAELAGASGLIKSDLGRLILTAVNTYAGGTTITGGVLQISDDVNLGTASGELRFNGGTLNTTADMVSDRLVDLIDAGTFDTDAATSLTLNGVISGLGGFTKKGAGDLILTGANTYDGAVEVEAGSLFVRGDQSLATGSIRVGAGALLGGDGVIGGDVLIANGATLSAGMDGAGTLAIGGDLELTAGSILDFQFGQANVAGGSLNDLVNVGGDLTLDGVLNVSTTAGGVFGPGVYRVFNYGGILTDNGLALGASPGGSLSVQTSVGGQVNLVNTGGLTLNFWDGAAGPKNDNAINGGDGVWRIDGGSNNWTDAGGTVNTDYAQDSFVIFSSAPGVVTVDNSGGDVQTSGMQFASDGYVLAGDVLTLTGSQAAIQVGDSSAAGAGYTATIDAELAGGAMLMKNDMGVLILNGNNTYIGGTTITGGVVRVSNDANLGAASGGLSFSGGVLDVTADMTSGRAFDFVGSGSIQNAANTTLTLTGALSGPGRLVKDGAGTLVLAGTGGTGGVTVDSGVVLVNGDYSAMGGLSHVASGATLGGKGVIGGDVSIADGGVLSPGAGAPGALTIGGDLYLSGGSRLAFDLGEANVAGGALNDQVVVGGDLTLDGVLDVTVPTGGAFDIGVYRLFDYGGVLTNNGPTLGSLPGGDASVQTSVLGQVNLINSAGQALNFWDGAAGSENDGVVNGGDGIWQAGTGNSYWTDQNGVVNAPYADSAFAIFSGVGGTVTIDGGLGDVTATGMQFAVDGYVITGDALTLSQTQSTIRVGDGTTTGAEFTATIKAVVQGAAQLVKTDGGRLILDGANTYAGGTLISGGTVQIASDVNLGEAAGAVTLDGGALATSADMTSRRDIVLAGAGTISTAADTTFTFDGLFSGANILTKTGEGVLEVTGDSRGFTGGVRVMQGILGLQGTMGGGVNVAAGARLEGGGRMASLGNAGVVAPGREGVFGALTVTGGYEGLGGLLEIETALGGDASPTDRLVIGGNAVGTTEVVVINRDGLGGQTVEGVKIIEVGGTSTGAFTLRGDYKFDGSAAVIAGAYGYRLHQGGVSTPNDGDWYLRSSLLNPVNPVEPEGPLYQPGVPIYEAYGANLQAINSLPTFQQRVGGRTWAQGADSASGGGWSRVEGVRTRGNAAVSTSQSEQDINSWKVQMGFDKVVAQAAWGGRLIAGVTAHYAEANSQIRSLFGSGVLETNGHGVGATLSWQGQTGLYLDSQAQVSWYQSDLESTVLGRLVTGNGGQGEAFSVEGGRRLPITDKVSITPQAQLIYSKVRFDGFADAADAEVSLDRGESLKTRLGLSIDQHEAWESGRGHVYAVANISYEWMDPSRVDVSGTLIEHADERLWGEVGIGFSATWRPGVTFFGETAVTSALEDGDSRSFRANAGVRIAF